MTQLKCDSTSARHVKPPRTGMLAMGFRGEPKLLP
jgi:hypothetical protein